MLAGVTLPSLPSPCSTAATAAVVPFCSRLWQLWQLATISFPIHSCPALRHARMQLRRDELLLKTFTGFISDFCCCCCYCCCCPGLLQDMPGLGRQSGIVIVAFICFIIYLYLFSGSLSLPCSSSSFSSLRICLLITHVIMSTATGHVSLYPLPPFPLSPLSLWHLLRSEQSQAMEQLV